MADMKIYTKTGDKGTTALWSGKRVTKNHPRLHAYGSIDELNSHLGVTQSLVLSTPEITSLSASITEIQNQLFLLGSYIACDEKKLIAQLPPLDTNAAQNLEVKIDSMQTELPTLTNFILPNGHSASAQLQVARCICRRAERDFIVCKDEVFENESIEIYLNRLSDYLFVAARWVNHKMSFKETIWSIK